MHVKITYLKYYKKNYHLILDYVVIIFFIELAVYGVGATRPATHMVSHVSAAVTQAGAQAAPAGPHAAMHAVHAVAQAKKHASQTKNPPSTGLTSRVKRIIRIITRASAFCPFIVVAVALRVVLDLAVSGFAVAVTKTRTKE